MNIEILHTQSNANFLCDICNKMIIRSTKIKIKDGNFRYDCCKECLEFIKDIKKYYGKLKEKK